MESTAVKPRKTLSFVSSRLVKEKSVKYAPEITSADDAIDCIKEHLSGYDREVFGALYLSVRGKVNNASVVSIGTMTYANVHPREVFRSAILAGAAAMILYHMHPSGDPTPSDGDVEATERLCRAGDLMGIKVLDHVIITDDKTFAMRSDGRYRNIFSK